jgi:nuclear pore complex protein Nup205
VLLAYYESLLALLQQLCQSKNGAISVLKSGLFESVRDSQLFAADPDIGIGPYALFGPAPLLSIFTDINRH